MGGGGGKRAITSNFGSQCKKQEMRPLLSPPHFPQAHYLAFCILYIWVPLGEAAASLP